MDNIAQNDTKLQYSLLTDAERRALIRYSSSYCQILAEYVPEFINEGVLPPAFTIPQLVNSFASAEIKVSRQSFHLTAKNPHNPVINKVANHPLVAESEIFLVEDPENTYFLRPRYEMRDMLEYSGYFREFEMGHRGNIPTIDIYEGALDDNQTEVIKQVYEKIGWHPPRRPLSWRRYYRYFMDFSNEIRTPINNAYVTKPPMFKVAFLDAVIEPGTWSSWEVSKKTGIHYDNIRNIVRKSGLEKDARRIVVNASNPWEALELAGEPGYAVRVGEGSYLVQLRSYWREKTEEELIEAENLLPLTAYEYARSRRGILPVYKTDPTPMFQGKFLLKSLRLLAKRAYGETPPSYLMDLSDIIEWIKERDKI